MNVPLHERAQLAARNGARVLVSIHANAGSPGARGSEVWLHDRHDAQSATLAREIHAQLDRVGPTRGLYQGPLTVLDPHATGGCAACLVEADYLSDPQGRARLTSSRGLDELADAISTGVRGYLGRAQGYGDGAWAVGQEIIEPDIAYASTSLAESNRIWNEWLQRYGSWRKGVPNGSLSHFPHSAICQLRMTMSTPAGVTDTFWGTGFYIGPNKLLTAAHNFRDSDENGVIWTTSSILVEPAYSPTASISNTRSFPVTSHTNHVHPNWSNATSDGFQPGYDIAVLNVNGLPATAGHFSLANRSLGAEEGIVVSGYGKVRGEDFDRQPQRMDGARISRADNMTMDYPIQTVGGHSGSPVFSDGMVVGVHRSSSGRHNNAAVTLTPEKIDWINRTYGNPGRSTGYGRVVRRDYESYDSYGTPDYPSPYEPYTFTDTAELDQYMRDQRAADTRRVSTVADAQALVDAYLTRGATTIWTGINATTAAGEIRARCANHRLFQQGNLNLCGPAAFLAIWAGRDPVGYARYALGLLESGVGQIGTHSITASTSIRSLAYPRLRNPNTTMSTPSADFIAMATLRNDQNAILPYDGSRSGELLAGLTTPEEVADWLRWTGVFSSVRQEANWARIAGYEHATRLIPGTGSDVAMLLNVNAMCNARRIEAVAGGAAPNPFTPDRSFILNQFPNHFVMLVGEVVPAINGTSFRMGVWTWGGSYVFNEVPWRDFVDNYYGAVTAHVRS